MSKVSFVQTLACISDTDALQLGWRGSSLRLVCILAWDGPPFN